jgi:hypothetical protein
MAELAPADVSAYTKGRLAPDDPETQRMLNAALQAVRREVGWHVSPVLPNQAVTIDGPGSRVLRLPTMKITELTSVTEDGIGLDPTSVAASAGATALMPEQVRLRKRNGSYWTDQYSGIDIVMSHGFSETEAIDWRQAILSMVDQMSLIPVKAATGMSDFGQRSWRVDDVQVAYNPYAALAEDVLFSAGNIIDKYRLPTLEFG